jgi:hypothetical protein
MQATYPFQILAMDHIPSLPKAYKGHTERLVWVDLSRDMSSLRRVHLGQPKRSRSLTRSVCSADSAPVK